ncbi:class I SAM-dependent methyltransferase [Listeria welshimeri]|nr:class I SAM-dependent methyltransferase [Listeria welshimeri]
MIYCKESATDFWSKRINSKDLNVVLGYKYSSEANHAYDMWEKCTICEMLKNQNVESILDFPTGNGRLLSMLSENFNQVYAADLSEKILSIAKKNVDKKNTSFIKADIESYHPESEFANIICTGLFEHIPIEVQNIAIKNFSEMLTIGGSLVLTINNDRNPSLADSNDNHFRQEKQLENGYYNGLNNLEITISKLEENNIIVERVAANPFWSMLRKLENKIRLEKGAFDSLFDKAIKNDIKYFNNITEICTNSDQFIIWGKKYER